MKAERDTPKKLDTYNPSKKKAKSNKRAWWKTVLLVILMLIWVGASVIVSQLVVGHIMLAILGSEIFNQSVVLAIYSTLSYVVAMFLIILVPIYAKKHRKKLLIKNETKTNVAKKAKTKDEQEASSALSERESLGLRGLPTWTDIGLAPVGFIVYLALAAGLVGLFSMFPWFNADEAQTTVFNAYNAGIDRVIAFIVLVVVAPIAEEIIFRGWLYGKMRKVLLGSCPDIVSMIISILLVSTLFGIVHLQWNVGVNVFAMSIVLCGLREITGTIYSGIILHILKNAIAFYMIFIMGMS